MSVSELTTREVENLFEEFDNDGWGSGWSDVEDYLDNWRGENEAKPVEGLGNVRLVDSATGGEEEASYCYMIFELEDGRFFRKEGYYASFHGTDWDGHFAEVAPAEKTITVYEQV